MSNNFEKKFQIHCPFDPSVPQKIAVTNLIDNLNNTCQDQVLLGATGTGKTFVMAQVIAQTNRPAIVLAHNKTLVAQLYQEFKMFFPENAVEYFVSYYDYYRPEAYVARTDTYIEKDASINESIDRLRHSTTRSLLTRNDVIVVASVSAIYGLGDRQSYAESIIELTLGQVINLRDLSFRLVALQYDNKVMNFKRGSFRVLGDIVEIFPAHSEDIGYRLSFFDNEIEAIFEFDVLTGVKIGKLEKVIIFANAHYVTGSGKKIEDIVIQIKQDLKEQVDFFKAQGRLVEAQRLLQRTEYDIEMLLTTKSCKGIENYTRYLTGRQPNSAPPTLFEYMPKNSILFVDESHVMIPQIAGMFSGDFARKQNLIHYGFRLPSALDNRPLKFEEFNQMRGQTIYVSATPAEYELKLAHKSNLVTELIIRPTGLIDPICEIRPAQGQVMNLISEIKNVCARNYRVLVTTLTKKMAEDLHEFLLEQNIAAEYLHSEVQTLKRIEIIAQLRQGIIQVLVGVNLLREGLDIPECALVAIMDADKEGFLRSTTALIQTIGRAARNIEGRVILYADKITNSMSVALEENQRRRQVQMQYNQDYNIIPQTIIKAQYDVTKMFDIKNLPNNLNQQIIDELELDKQFKTNEAAIKFYSKKMMDLAKQLKFEQAKILRDKIKQIQTQSLM